MSKRMMKVIIDIICYSLLALYICMNLIFVSAADNNKVALAVKNIPNINISLTKSKTNVDLTNFKNDMLNKIEEEGISRDKVNINSLDSTEVNLQDGFDWKQDKSSQIGNITIEDEGKTISMVGNAHNAGKNAIYIIPENTQEQEISMHYKSDFGDSFNSAGLLVRVKESGNELSGYMIAFGNTCKSGIYEFSYTKGQNTTNINKTLKRELNINSEGDLTVTITENDISVTGGGLQQKVVYELETIYGEGYGFYSDHFKHGCDNIGEFKLTNITFKTVNIKSVANLLRTPTWNSQSINLIVNVTDSNVEEMSDTNFVMELVLRMLNDNVYYVAWGNEENKVANEKIITANNNKGMFVNNGNYQNAVSQTVRYIKDLLSIYETNDNYVLIDKPMEIEITPEGYKKNTADSVYPNGKWKLNHDYEYFENNNGQYENSGKYINDFPDVFTKVGRYELTYEDSAIEPRYIYVHRKPIAVIKMNVNNDIVTLESNSYDLDKQSVNNGISQEEWSYKKSTDTEWTTGKLEQIDGISEYIVRLRVKDYQDTWSDYNLTYISPREDIAPIASFTIANSEITKYEQLQVIDNSYDPAGKTITSYEWTITKDGERVYKGNKIITNYLTYGVGQYTMTLSVTNSNNIKSEEYSKEFTITDDVIPPEFIAEPINAETIEEKIDVDVEFSDIGAGFDYYKYAITYDDAQVTSWSQKIYNQQDTITVGNPVTTDVEDKDIFIHVIGVDKAGNESEDRILGPYRINSVAPTLKASIEGPYQSVGDPIDVDLRFSDVGVGFNYYKYAITYNDENAYEWSEEIHESMDTIRLADVNTDMYLHVKATDLIGNESEDIVLGPYRVCGTKFDLEVHVVDDENKNVSLGKANFSLIHPKQDAPDERIILYGTTGSDGICHIYGHSVGVGTYEYILYETKAPTGYEAVGLTSLQITFDEDGQITKVKKQFNSAMDIVEWDSGKIVMSVGSEKQQQMQNIFNVKLEVEDEDNSDKKVKSSTYRISTVAQSGEESGIVESTDSNGIIDLKNQFAGNGQIEIHLQNTDTKGYVLDTEEKIVVINKDNTTGLITYIRWKSDENAVVSINGNTVEIKLKAKSKEIKNRIHVQLTDIENDDLFVKGAKVRLKEASTNVGNIVETDENGNAVFEMDGSDIGKHIYEISLPNKPDEYKDLENDIKIEVEYDDNGNIKSVKNIKNNEIQITYGVETNCYQIEEETILVNTAVVKVGLKLAEKYKTYSFNLYNKDKDGHIGLANVEYDITIQNGSYNKKISNKTDSRGLIKIIFPGKDNTTITIKETKAKAGYILDSEDKVFEFGFDEDDKYIIKRMSDNIDTNNVIMSQNTITFDDFNIKKITTPTPAKISLRLTNEGRDGATIGNGKFNIRELKSGEEYTNVEANGLGEIFIENFYVDSVGTYTLEIEQTGVAPGYDILESKIIVELDYEILDDVMFSTKQRIVRGDKLVKEKKYDQYETLDKYQMDVSLIVVNTVDMSNASAKVLLDTINLDAEDNTILYGGSSDIYVQYIEETGKPSPNDTKVAYTITYKNISIGDGIEIQPLGLYNKYVSTIIDFSSENEPIGYEYGNYRCTVKLDSENKPYIDSYSYNADKCRIYERVNKNYTSDTILEVKRLLYKKQPEFNVIIKSGVEGSDEGIIKGVTFNVSFDGITKNWLKSEYTTNSDGKAEISDLKGKGEISLKIRQKSVPAIYKAIKKEINVILNRDPDNFDITYNANESDLPVENIEIDYQKQQVIITIKNEIDFKINIEKVDELNQNKKLQNAKFEVEPVCVKTRRKVIIYYAAMNERSEDYSLYYSYDWANETNPIKSAYQNGAKSEELTRLINKMNYILNDKEITYSSDLVNDKNIIMADRSISWNSDQQIPGFPKRSKGKYWVGYLIESDVEPDYSLPQYPKTVETDANGIASVIYNTSVVNKVVDYKIKEIEAPDGYRKSKEFTLRIVFGENGAIKEYELIDPSAQDEESDDSDEYVTALDWAEIYKPQQYVMNSTTGEFDLINVYKDNSEITIQVKDGNKYNFAINKVDSRRELAENSENSGNSENSENSGNSENEETEQIEEQKPITGAEFDITIRHNGKSEQYHKTTLDGLIELNNLEGEGEIEIEYQETSPAFGYEKDDLSSGKIVFDKETQTSYLTLNRDKTTTDLRNVSVDNESGKITVTVENDSNLKMGIKTVDAITNMSLDGARYTITSSKDISDTQETANGGEAIFNIGSTYTSTTVRYTIRQDVAPTGYEQVYNLIDDIVIDFHFNEFGGIGYSIVSGEDRVSKIEIPNNQSLISQNFIENNINIEITNGEQDEYTLKFINENEMNSNIKIEGTEYHIFAENPDGSEQFNNPSMITDRRGEITIEHVDIQHGFKLSIQELKNSDGYTFDDTLRVVDFTATLSTTGGKLIEAQTTDQRLITQVDNINNIVEIRIINEPNNIGVTIKVADMEDNTILLEGARMIIEDVETQNEYIVATSENGFGYAYIPIKPNGIYTYKLVENQAPLGYKKADEMSIQIGFKDNEIESVVQGSNSNLFDIDDQKPKYIEMTVKNEQKSLELEEYTIEVHRVNAQNTSEGVANVKTRVEVVNSEIATITKEDYTNGGGSIFVSNGMKGPGQTIVKITELEKAGGYVWDARDKLVYLDRNSETDEITCTAATYLSRTSDVYIDEVNKLITITIKNNKEGVYVSTSQVPTTTFNVKIVSVAKGTATPVVGYYSTEISPDSENPGPGWSVSSYSFLNSRTDIYYKYWGWEWPWDPWTGWYTDPRPVEMGTITMGGLRGTGDINIKINQNQVASGYQPLSDEQHIIVNRDTTTGALTVTQEGIETSTTIDQNSNTIVVTVEVVPTFTLTIKKQDTLDSTKSLEGAEFEVASTYGQTASAQTDEGGNALILTGETKPNTSAVYTIRETKIPDGYKPINEIKLRVSFDSAGMLSDYQIIDGTNIQNGKEVARIDLPEQIYYGYQHRYAYLTTNTAAYKGTGGLKIIIKNDDSFKMEIMDEDKDLLGVGIQDSRFKVTVTDDLTGEQKIYGLSEDEKTNENGLVSIENITGYKLVTLHYEQIEAGEGYETDTSISGDIKIYKNPVNYDIKLLSYSGSGTDVQVDESNGIVKVVVKNERKLQLELEKVDINDPENVKLRNAEFNIKSKVIMRQGTTLVDEPEIGEGTIETDINGIATMDLRKSEPGTKVRYILEETKAPEGYESIGEIRIDVDFDSKGRVSNVQNLGSVRVNAYKKHIGKIAVRVANGTTYVNAYGENVFGYDFKIQTTDKMIANYPIDGAIYNVKVFEDNLLVEDTDIKTKTNTINSTVIEKGIATLKGLRTEGIVRLEFTQKKATEGYVIDNTQYTIQFNCTYTPAQDYAFTKDVVPVLTLDQLNTTVPLDSIQVDNELRVIKVNLDNEPEVLLGIKQVNIDEGQLVMPTKTYRITALQGTTGINEVDLYSPITEGETIDNIINSYTTTTTLNVEKTTNTLGEANISLGRPVPSTTMIYVIDELTENNTYENVTKLLIRYDQYGKIEKTYLLTYKENIELDDTEKYTGLSHVNINVYSWSEGLNLTIEKVDSNDKEEKLDGAKFVVIDSEIYANDYDSENDNIIYSSLENDGIEQAITSNGKLNIKLPNKSVGEYEFKIEEVVAPRGYLNPETEMKLMVEYNSFNEIVGARISRGDDIAKVEKYDASNVKVQVKNEQDPIQIGGYDLEIIAVDSNNKNVVIPDARLKVTVENEIGITHPITKDKYTDEDGKIEFTGINGAGNINVKIEEIEAPFGRKLDTKQKEANIERNPEDGTMKLNDAINVDVSADGAQQKITIYVANEPQDELYTLYLKNIDRRGQAVESDKIEFKISENGIINDETPTYTTNEQGEIVLQNLKIPDRAGKYVYLIKQVKEPDWYKKNDEVMELELNIIEKNGVCKIEDATIKNGDYISVVKQGNNYVGLEFENILIDDPDDQFYYELELQKTDGNDQNIEVEGIEFEIGAIEDGEETIERDIVTTDESGKIRITDIRMPDENKKVRYSIIETKGPEGYEENAEEMIIEIEFKRINREMKIVNAEVIKGEKISMDTIEDGKIGIKVKNVAFDDTITLTSDVYMITDEKYMEYQGNKNEYQEGDKYILGLEARIKGRNIISKGTTKETFLNNIETNAQASIYKVNGDELRNDEYIGTGMILQLERGSNIIELKLIVAGDCARNQLNDPNNAQVGAGDGYLDTTDIATIKLMSGRNYTNKTTEQTLAGDIGVNNYKTDASDIATMKIMITKGYIDNLGNTKKGVEYYE